MTSEERISEILKSMNIQAVQDKRSALEKCEYECAVLNKGKGDLDEIDGYHCKICNDKGNYYKVSTNYDKPIAVCVKCSCWNTRRILRKLAKSGLSNVIQKCTFDKYISEEEWQKQIKEKAKSFINDTGKWFFIGGQSGCGKSHICTAICGAFLKKHKNVSYMLWVDDMKHLKNTITDNEAHTELINKFKTADVLYIDDLFKNGKDRNGTVQPPSAADIQMAFEIINYRYNNENLITIISSEKTLFDIMDIDEAIAGRITERVGGKYGINIKADKKKNYRTKGMIEL